MGLLMLILIGILPATYAVNPNTTTAESYLRISQLSASADSFFQRKAAGSQSADVDGELSAFLKKAGEPSNATFSALSKGSRAIVERLPLQDKQNRSMVRKYIYLVSRSIRKLRDLGQFEAGEQQVLMSYQRELEGVVNYIPGWVKSVVAVALGLGTMIGWKRIVVTVGEKIGKAHLSYVQGASAELVAMGTIAAADLAGLPVSTTHVLSSGVAGAMAANRSGLQMGTVRNLLLAWVLTLPVCVLLGASLFSGSLYLFLHILGLN
jgi:PiT family inorganic phosphate transporter